MTINLNLPANWRSTLSGLLTAAGLAATAYIQSGHKFDLHDPLLWSAVGSAVWAWYTKDKNVTGGTVANSSNSADVVASTAAPKSPAA